MANGLGFIDYSNHQSDLDVSKIDNPAPYIIVKATEGKGWVDPHFKRFTNEIRAIGKIPGWYHFISQSNTPRQEADNFIRQVSSVYRPGELLILDHEPTGSNPSPKNTDWPRQWLQMVEPEFGSRPWIYMNLSTANAVDWGDIAINNPLWVAAYGQNPVTHGYNPTYNIDGKVSKQWRTVIAHQFTDKGRLSGYNKNLDLNLYYGDAVHTPDNPNPPVVVKPNPIPPLKEADPHRTWRDSNGRTWKVCLCMEYTLPLIEAEMKKRGLIKYAIDIFQGAYNPGRVAASAGTHDLGGVIDVLQGITLEQRKVWAMFGVMMFPRIPQYGWRTGDHGHGVWHGCPHQTVSADRQVTNGIAGRDGLVSNIRRNFEAPKRTWQEAYLEATASSAPIIIDNPKNPVPNELWAEEQLARHGFTRHTDFKLNLREFQMAWMGRYIALEQLDEPTIKALKRPKHVSSLRHATEYFTPIDVRLVRYAMLKLKVALQSSTRVLEQWNSDFSYQWSQAAYLLGLLEWQAERNLELYFPMPFEYWQQFAQESEVFEAVE